MRANPLKGEATFLYGPEGEEEEFTIILDNQTWIEAEEILDESILDIIEEIRATLAAGRNPKIRHMAAIVYGGMRRKHPELTQADVVDMFFSGHEGFKEAVLAAMRGAQTPDLADDEGQAGNAPGRAKTAKKVGTGSTSSKPGAKRASTPTRSGAKRPAR